MSIIIIVKGRDSQGTSEGMHSMREGEEKSRKKIKKPLDFLPKSAIIELPKEREITADGNGSATFNLLGCQEEKELA